MAKYNKSAVYKACLINDKMADKIEYVADTMLLDKDFIQLVMEGVYRSALIYGGAGMGKTHLVETAFKEAGMVAGEDYLLGRGTTSPVMFYAMLYEMRDTGKFVLIDDCDAILRDEDGINVLKAAMDNEFRRVGWNTKSNVKRLTGTGVVPKQFTFNGTVIANTNVAYSGKTGKMAQHFEAIKSRTAEHRMEFDTKDEQFAYVFHLIMNLNYLDNNAETLLTQEQKIAMLRFIMSNLSVASRIDARTPQKLARLIIARPNNWQNHARRLLEQKQ